MKGKTPGMQERKHTTITIPAQLFGKIKEMIKDTGFSSVSDYATFVLRENVSEFERAKGRKGKSEEESGAIKKLKSLGYLQ